MKRVGIDVGGTFTDLVVYDPEAGSVERTKMLTNHRNPSLAVGQALGAVGLDLDDRFELLHGTTLVTNIIVERNGAKVGLLTTEGFRDVLEIMRGDRESLYDLQWDRPKHFVPRRLRAEVPERIDHRGEVVRPLDEEKASQAIAALVEAGVDGVAICLLHSYRNDVHERRLKALIERAAPGLPVSASSEVNREIREYERMSTTVLNSYVAPRFRAYDAELGTSVDDSRDLKYMHSAGGLMKRGHARELPISLAFSGPAAGVQAAAYFAEVTGNPNLIAIDMGGTSLDMCLVQDGAAETAKELDIEWGIPVRTPATRIRSIGAGGGSIAWVDAGGALRVGPRSAGSDPGPACYGGGGREPTVTDANLVLGLVDQDAFLGGTMKLDREAAVAAFEPLVRAFDRSTEEVAAAVHTMVNVNMAQAIRQITIERGIDPREFAMISYGGACGQHAVELAREVGVRKVLFPALSSTLSAFGMLTADLQYTRSRSVLRRLNAELVPDLEREWTALEREARAMLGGDVASNGQARVVREVDARYAEQSHEITVACDGVALTPEGISDAFEQLHHRMYGTRLGDEIEVVGLHVTVSATVPRPAVAAPAAESSGEPQASSLRHVGRRSEPIAVYARATLTPGMSLAAPCVVEDTDTSIFVPDGYSCHVDAHGNIVATAQSEEL